MKQLQSIILLVCIATSIHLYVQQADTTPEEKATKIVTNIEQQADNTIDENNASTIAESTKNIDPDTVILFFAQDDEHDTDNPSGRYWPAESFMLHGNLVNSALAYIGNDEYSYVVEAKSLLPNQELRYLGHFINQKSEEKIYLYGTKDKTTPNDANEETVSDDDEAGNDDNNDVDEDN